MGTLVNAIAVVAGSLIGLLIRRGLPERVEGAAMKLLGLSVLIIGFNGVVTSMVTVGADGSLSSDGSLLLIASLVIGGVSGELWEIDDKLTRMGKRIEERFGKEGFAKGFINGSLIYCIGAMAIIGALNDGLTGDSSILYIKSVLDHPCFDTRIWCALFRAASRALSGWDYPVCGGSVPARFGRTAWRNLHGWLCDCSLYRDQFSRVYHHPHRKFAPRSGRSGGLAAASLLCGTDCYLIAIRRNTTFRQGILSQLLKTLW